MKFVFATDENYWMQTFIAIYSLIANNAKSDLEIYILCERVDEKFKFAIEKLKLTNENILVEFPILEAEIEKISSFTLKEHLTRGTYYRFFIQEFLPSDIEKIIYLDGDIIVNGSLAELYNVDLTHHLLAAVPQIEEGNPERLGLPSGSKYFNAGVLVINLKKWRAEDISTRLITYSEENQNTIQWPSQDPLNAVASGQWIELPKKFNYYHGFAKSRNGQYKHVKPLIVHYSGSIKPWQYRGSHPYKLLYWKYLLNTPYCFYLPDDLTLLNVMKSMLPRSLRIALKARIHDALGFLMKT